MSSWLHRFLISAFDIFWDLFYLWWYETICYLSVIGCRFSVLLTLVVAVVVVSVVEFDAVVVVIELYLLKCFSVSRSQQSRLEVVNYERLCRYCFTLLLLLLLILLLFFGCRCCLQSIVVDVGVDFSDVVIVLVGVDIVDFNCCCRCRLLLLLLLSW